MTRTPDGEIEGWFNFADIYREAVATAPCDSHLVEVGVWQGKSLVYLLDQARQANRNLKIYGVDTFEGSSYRSSLRRKALKVDIEAICRRHCARVDYPVRLIRAESVVAATRFVDRSLHFVFVDAAHDHASVCADITAWLPKVKIGEILAGHDYNLESVQRATAELLGPVEVRGKSWVYRVPEASHA